MINKQVENRVVKQKGNISFTRTMKDLIVNNKTNKTF